jgi:hypothetical protein
MAKSTPPIYAEKDDPIYNGKFVLSSQGSKRESMKSMQTSPTDTASQETLNSTMPSEDRSER